MSASSAPSRRGAGGIHGGVPTAVDSDPAADGGPVPGCNAAQERNCIHHPRRITSGDVHMLGKVSTDRHEHCVEATFELFSSEVLHSMSGREADAQRFDPCQLGAQHVTWKAVRRYSVSHHSARLDPEVAYLDVVTPPCEVISSRESARSSADNENPMPGRCGRRAQLPAFFDSEVPEEPLDGVNRHSAVELARLHALSQGW